MGLVAHALRGVVRNRRRSFAAVLGTLLVVSIVAGENIALDSSIWSLWESTSQGMGSHFRGDGPLNRSGELRDAMAAVPGFAEISATGYLPFSLQPVNGSVPSSFGVLVVRPDYERSFPYRGLRGSLVISDLNVTVTESFSRTFGVRVGDIWTANASRWGDSGASPWVHYPLRIASILTDASAQVPGYSTLLLSIDFMLAASRDLNATYSYDPFARAVYEGWFNVEEVIDPFDVEGSQAVLRRVMRSLDAVARPLGVSIYSDSPLQYSLEFFSGFALLFRLLFLLVSIPVLVLALHLGAVGVDLGMAERRREIGLLKARGASNAQVFLGLQVEAIVLSVLAALGGLALGIGVSQVLLASGMLSILTPVASAHAVITVTSVTVVLAVAFAFLFMLAGAYRPFRRASRISVGDGLSYYTPGEVTIRYKPGVDLALIGLASLTFIMDFLLETGNMSSLAFLVAGLFTLLTPFAPFLLALGLSRLLTRGVPKLYSKGARIARPLVGELWPLVARNLARNPRRASSVTSLMSLALVFGLMITLLYSSQIDLAERGVRADHGGDIRVDLLSWTDLAAARAEVLSVPGVAGAAPVLIRNYGPQVVALDTSAYLAVVPRDDSFFQKGTWDSLRQLGSPGAAVITPAMAEWEGVSMGDSFLLEDAAFGGNGSSYVTLTVVGIARALPGGQEYPSSFGGSGAIILFVDQRSLRNATVFGEDARARVLVSVDAGANASAIGDALQALHPMDWYVSVATEELAHATEGPSGAFLRLMAVQIAFAILIVTAGLALILYASTIERAPEFAGMVARGASRRQIVSLLLGETSVILVLGLAIGVVVGVFAGWGLIEAFTRNDQSVIQARLVFSWEGVAVVLATVASMVTAATVIAERAGRSSVAELLRQRGG